MARAHAPEPLPWGAIECIGAAALEGAARALLDHRRNLTVVLEEHYGERAALQVLRRHHENGAAYWREIVLRLERSGRVVEYAAIEIDLAGGGLPAAARERIVTEAAPLAHILRDLGLTHRIVPEAFVRVRCDARMGGALGVSPGTPLFGRCTSLVADTGPRLARIVELLGPLAAARP